MSAPNGGYHDDGPQRNANQGLPSLTLPPISSLNFQLSRSTELEAVDAAGAATASSVVPQAPTPDIYSSSSLSSQHRRDSSLQWRPLGSSEDVNMAAPPGNTLPGLPREVQPPLGRSYHPDPTFPPSLAHEPTLEHSSQFRTFSALGYSTETAEMGSLSEFRTPRRTPPGYPPSQPYPQLHYPESSHAPSPRPARSSTTTDPGQEYRSGTTRSSSSQWPSPTTSMPPPLPPVSSSPGPPHPRAGYAMPPYSSGPIAPSYPPYPARPEPSAGVGSSGFDQYGHIMPPQPASDPASIHSRPWPERSLHYVPFSEPGPSRQPSLPGTRAGGLPDRDRWGLSEGASMSPIPPALDTVQAGRLRSSPSSHLDSRPAAELSASIAEIISHCTVLTHFAKVYADKQAQGDTTDEQPSIDEVQQMVQRATSVAQLLDNLRVARLSEEAEAAQPAGSSIGTKRSWDSTQSTSPIRPLKLVFENRQNLRSISEPLTNSPELLPYDPSTMSAKAREDLELIKRKRHASTGTPMDPPPPPPKAKKRGPRTRNPSTSMPGECAICKTRETPEWRRGPNGPRTLCNACGLHWAKETREAQAVEEAQASQQRARGPDSHEGVPSSSSSNVGRSGNATQGAPRGGRSHLPTGPSPSTRLAPVTTPISLPYPGDPPPPPPPSHTG